MTQARHTYAVMGATGHVGSVVAERLLKTGVQVRGIGRWTVEMLLLFDLGRPDVWPVYDYGVRKGFAKIFGKRKLPTPKQMVKQGQRFAPYRSALAWYCWRALDDGKG